MSLHKSQPDKRKKMMLNQDIIAKKLQRPKTLGENAKLMPWHEHASILHVIDHYTTVINGQAYVTRAAEGQTIVATIDIDEENSSAWIVCIENETGLELFRKNPLYVDLIQWAYEDVEEEDDIEVLVK